MRTARRRQTAPGRTAAAGLAALLASFGAAAGSFEIGEVDVGYQVQLGYALAVRTEERAAGIIDAPPSPRIPLPDYLKLPESINYDDGDRNFDRWSPVNNRVSGLAEIVVEHGDFGVMLRGDGFYDDVYHRRNDNRWPDTVNHGAGPADRFTPAARRFDGGRTRLLDAYAFGTWYFGDAGALNLRAGRHIAAWGESLFFAGVALAQAPADATKATVPGADVKSILLPVNQISMQLSLTGDVTLLGQYKLEFKEVELNPPGEFFSVADVVGPGAEFIYGIDNPLYLASYDDLNLLSGDVPAALDLVLRLMAPELPAGQVAALLGASLDALDPLLPDQSVPVGQIEQPGVPRYINVERGADVRPGDGGQWGAGISWQALPSLNLGIYRLRYHNTTPAPVQTYGYAVLLPASGAAPAITTEQFGLRVPVVYNVHYFDGIDLSAASFSTTLFGVSFGGEAIYRDGVDVLVDVDGGLLGPVPTPTRAKIRQGLLSALWTTGPALFWDAFTIVGESGWIRVDEVEEACGPTSCSTDLTFTREAWGYSLLTMFDRRNVFAGWDLQVPVTFAAMGKGHSSFLSGFGSLTGENDKRAGIGVNFTRLQELTLGVQYSGYLGTPHFRENPYADRDNLAFTATYRF